MEWFIEKRNKKYRKKDTIKKSIRGTALIGKELRGLAYIIFLKSFFLGSSATSKVQESIDFKKCFI